MTCAHVVHVALKKVPGVDSVHVNLNAGLASVKLRPANTVTVEQLWEIVKNNGFSPKETRVTVQGELILAQGKPQLKVSGTNKIYDVVVDSKNESLSKYSGQSVVLEGVMMPVKDKKAARPIHFRALKPAARKGA